MNSVIRAFGVLLILAVVCEGGCSPRASAAGRFAGRWEASHEGVPYFRVTIRPTAPVSGEVMVAFVHADGQGRILEARAEPSTVSELSSPRVEGDRLSFLARDGDELVRFTIALTGEDVAEVRFPGAPEGFPPFPLRRVAGGG